MAALVSRPRRDGTTAYKVQWRLGGSRDGTWQSETFDDRRQALRFRAQVEANHHLWPDGWVKGWGFGANPQAVDAVGARTSLEEFGTTYVRRLTSAGPDTQTRYLAQVSRLVGWITDATGFVPELESFSSDDDRDWINARRRAGASPKTIANYHGLLAAIFKDAVHKGLVIRSPCEGVRLPTQESAEDDGDRQFLTEDEFAVLLGAMNADSRDLLTVAVGTGLRWGELTALRVEDLQLGGKVPHLSVRRAWKRNGTGDFAVEGEGRFYLGSPKTRESRRKVSLSQPVVDVLRRVTAKRDSGDLVFPAPEGGRLDQGNWYAHRWQVAVRAARAAGLASSPRFHDLRHTHAAWLISAGVPLPVIQKRLGHKSIKITVDVYGGLLVQTHEVADLAMARALSGKHIVAPGTTDPGFADEELSAVSAPAG
ncbi:MAG: site-specific integrase [Actinomycetota bacterium]|nr:site-specific integrase [Actinomycetota bacterium]